MTTTVKITKQIEEEIQITFPIHKKFGESVYQISSEKDCICVKNDSFCTSQRAFGIEIMRGYPATVGLYISKGEDITKEDFEKNFSLALSHINHAAFIHESAA